MDSAIEVLADSAEEARARRLFLALQSKDVEVVAKLLDSGIDPDINYERNWRPIHIAAALGDQHLIALLIERGANTLAATSDEQTVLHVAAINRAPEETLSELRSHFSLRGKRTVYSAKDTAGRTALMYAVMHGHHTAIKYLIPSPSDDSVESLVNEPDSSGLRPAYIAALRDDTDTLDELVARGASISDPRDKVSLHEIARARKNWLMLARLPSDRRIDIPVSESMPVHEVARYQENLARFGYYKGKVDGQWGPTTRAATRVMLYELREQFKNMALAIAQDGGDGARAHNGTLYKRYDGTVLWRNGFLSLGEDVPYGWALINEPSGRNYFGQWHGAQYANSANYKAGIGSYSLIRGVQ
jgi:hypothetical protein